MVEVADANVPGRDGMPPTGRGGADAWSLTEVVTRLRRVLRSSVRHEFPWESLPMAQVEILQCLAEESDLRVGDLASRQRLATNTVSNLIQQMVTSRLVERRPHLSDRRAVSLSLSAHGTDVLASWQQANDIRLGRALASLPRRHQDAIKSAVPALAALTARLEAGERDDNGGSTRA